MHVIFACCAPSDKDDPPDTLRTVFDVQNILETDEEEDRLMKCFEVFRAARDHLKLRQRLKNIVENRIGDTEEPDEP